MAPALTKTHKYELGEEYYQLEITDLDNGEDYDLDLGDIYGRVWYWVEHVSGQAYADDELVLRDGSATGENAVYPTSLGTHVRPTGTTMGLIVEPGQILNFQNVAPATQTIIVHVLALDQR